MFKKFNKYFKIYWITIMCLLTLCAMIFLVAGYNSHQKNIESEEFVGQMTKFEQDRKELEFKIGSVVSLGRILTEYECVKRYASDSLKYDKMDFGNIYAISDVLSGIQFDYESLELDIQLFRDNSDVIIAPMRTLDEKEFEQIYTIKKEDIVDMFADNTLKYNYKIIPQMQQDGTVMFAFVKTYSQLYKIYGLMCFKDVNIRYVQLINNKTIFIGKDGGSISAEKLKTEDLIEDVVYRHEVSNNENAVYGVLKNYPNMLYITNNTSTDNGIVLFMYIVLGILALAIIFYTSLYITKIIYKPIASLINIFGGDMITNYKDEFEFLNQAAKTSLSTNNDLMFEIDKMKRERKYKFLYDLLNGFVWGDGISKAIDKYELTYLYGKCHVVIFEFKVSGYSTMCDDFSVIDSYASTLYSEMEKEFKSELFEKWVDDENRVICIMGKTDNIKEKITHIVDNMSKKDVFIVASISNAIDKAQDLSCVYDALSRLLKYSVVVGKNVLIQEEDEIYSVWDYYTIEQESQLEELIINGQYEKALFILRRILAGFKHDKKLKEDDEYKFKMMIVLNTIRFLKQSGLKLLKVEDDLISLRENVIIDRHTFCEEVLKQYKNIIKGFEANVGSSYHAGEQIMEYINQNYMKDISMDNVCEAVGMSASTVTRKLDELYGVKFKTYLTELRIEKAKYLIKENRAHKIKDIADAVGFNNALSFGRAFKRVEGVSVGDYLKKYING